MGESSKLPYQHHKSMKSLMNSAPRGYGMCRNNVAQLIIRRRARADNLPPNERMTLLRSHSAAATPDFFSFHDPSMFARSPIHLPPSSIFNSAMHCVCTNQSSTDLAFLSRSQNEPRFKNILQIDNSLLFLSNGDLELERRLTGSWSCASVDLS